MDSDHTPADVIAVLFEAWDHRNYKAADAPAVIERLAAAGYRVTPIPDDNTRTERDVLLDVAHAAWELIECSSKPPTFVQYLHLEVDHDRLRDAIDQLLATGWQPHEIWSLDGQPQDRPAHCPECDSDDPAVRLPVQLPHRTHLDYCPHTWHVGGSGDTR